MKQRRPRRRNPVSLRTQYKDFTGTAKYMVQIYSDGKYYTFYERSMSDARQQAEYWSEGRENPFQYKILEVVERGEYR